LRDTRCCGARPSPLARDTTHLYAALTKLRPSVLAGGSSCEEKAMTSLEKALAGILELIEKARAAGNALLVDTLIQRKHAICAALAAPEQH
jgi:hypothetical protein